MSFLKYLPSYRRLQESIETRNEHIAELEKELKSLQTATDEFLNLRKTAEVFGRPDPFRSSWYGEFARSLRFKNFVETEKLKQENKNFEDRVRAIKCEKKEKKHG